MFIYTAYADRHRTTHLAATPVMSDLSGSAVCGIGAVMELPVKLPGVKVQHKLPQFAFHTGKMTQGDILKRRNDEACQQVIKGLAVQIPAPTVHGSEVSLGKALHPPSGHPLVCE